jgi:hypothetical protein
MTQEQAEMLKNEYRTQLEIVAELDISSEAETEKLASIYYSNVEEASAVRWTDELSEKEQRKPEA